MKNNVSRILALLLVCCMLFGLAACGNTESAAKENGGISLEVPGDVTGNENKDETEKGTEEKPSADKENSQTGDSESVGDIVDILPNTQTDTNNKPSAEQLGNQTGNGTVSGGSTEQNQDPEDVTPPVPDAYDQTGAMTKPFDQVYPELIEKEEVSFSGESILVKMASNKLTDGLKAAGIGALEEIVPMGECAWYEAKLTQGTDAKKALTAIRSLDEVLLAEYNYEIEVAALDDYKHYDKEQDKEFKKNGHNKDQWHFHHCGIVDGYKEMEKDGGDSSVIVAVIDSGVDYNHEDLKDNMWVNTKEIPDNGIDDDQNGYIDDYYGVDIVSRKGNGDDTNGHGTHVAGIIAARNNNVGVLGIAYNVKIMSVKAAMHNGTLNQADIAKAVLYAYENGAEVINMSFGGTACSIAVQDALATAYTRCVLVASAGNSGENNEPTPKDPIYLPNYPAALTYVLGVMSVDQNGVESSFTNWDVKAFNGVEYELYAPGENIMSTLPGNKYGYLSGTSMAAPVVSAFAAILRSEFSDRDMYPTKFIYGQLTSTSEIYATCVNPQAHEVAGMPHNLPQVADLHAALTKLPKPELNVQDYALFDDPKYSSKNNGDGVIDAGETIALGLTIRNRWGMSENTKVTIDTISGSSGLADPYITIHNPSVDYGSVGTYSTQDCGRIYTDDLLTGWEKPFLITISQDCPNDYRFTLNITITCENALDKDDKTVYVFGEKPYPITLNENVRSGYILPSIISEDMVLTKDNLYIIPNATIIEEGVTVRVEPGTHIQFWGDDANDPYADSYIAYLLVNGKFLVEGTKEEPVYIYTSQLMDHYGVEIGASSKGYVSLKYADVTNFAYDTTYRCDHTGTGNRINLAEHCTFRNNYSGYFNCRYLEDGVIKSHATGNVNIGRFNNARDCAFYKLATEFDADLFGTFDRCVFTQCGIDFSGEGTYRDCVFLGNSMVDQTNPNKYYNSSLPVNTISLPDEEDISNDYSRVYYRPETGTTYVWWDNSSSSNAAVYLSYLQEYFGGDFAKIETDEERVWLADKLIGNNYYQMGIRWDKVKDCYTWSDGTPVDLALFPNLAERLGNDDTCVHFNDLNGQIGYDNYAYRDLYEIPGPILPTDITFSAYTVDMDRETTYQLVPMNTPVQLPTNAFLYESTDETVITVSETGLVTPVGNGTADVWVWSLDKAVKNRVTFTVRDYVALEGIAFPVANLKLEVGKSAHVPCTLTPADTTRHNVTYTSSDPSVVTAENGLLTAVGKGTATITAQCEGLTATLEVTTWVRATSLKVEQYEHTRTAESGDTSLPKLTVYPANADLDLEWSTEYDYVSIEDGKLLVKKTGTTYVYATDRNSGLKATFQFKVTATAPTIQKDVIAVQLGAEPVSLPEVLLAEGLDMAPVWTILDPAVAEVKDGNIVFNGAGITTLRVTDPRNGLTDEIFLYVTEGEVPRIKELWGNGANSDYYVALMEDGSLYHWCAEVTNQYAPKLIQKNVRSVSLGSNSASYALLLEDGKIETYSNTTKVGTYTLPADIDAVSIAGYYYTSGNSSIGTLHVLDKDGKVYAIGENIYGALGIGITDDATELTPVLMNEPVVKIANDQNQVAYYLTESGKLYISGGSGLKVTSPVAIARDVTWLDDHGQWFVSGNTLFRFKDEYTEPQAQNGDFTGYMVLDINNDYGASTSKGIALKNGKLYRISEGNFYTIMLPVTSAIDGAWGDNSGIYYYVVNEEGMLLGCGKSDVYNSGDWGNVGNGFLGMANKVDIGTGVALFLPIVRPQENLKVLETNLDENGLLTADTLEIRLNKQLFNATVTITENGTTMVAHKEIKDEWLQVTPAMGLEEGVTYTLTITASGTTAIGLVKPAEDIVITFTYKAPAEEKPEEGTPEGSLPEESLPVVPEEDPVVYEAIVDASIVRYWTERGLIEALEKGIEETQYNPRFTGNAILNPISTDTNVEHWLRPLAQTVAAGEYMELPLGGNWWGTTNETAIGLQMVDYTDFVTYGRLMYAPYLTEAPENTFPFVTSVKLFNKDGEQVTIVGNEEITFQVKFNRDMDTSIPLLVRYGSAFPYGDYEVEGAYVDARTWEGTYTLNTLIENGYHYFTISNGCSATDDLELQLDQYRFSFEIDTTAAQALIMQGTAMDTGIELKWTQDDFKTLMGYNVYRSTKEDGLYTRLNKTVIPTETMEWFDDTVEPGVTYYYNFTVVQTDLSESEPSGKIVIMSKDTMAPNIYHSPVVNAFTGSNLVVTATVTDNLNISYANLYYRVTGTETWNIVRMNKLNDKYSAIIPASDVTLEGVEYYLEAFDGVSSTYKGSAAEPFTIAVQEAIGADALGDVDGDGVITNLDALLLLYTINDKYNMTTEEFARADLNGDGDLWAAEALQILRYVSGEIGSVKM